MGVMSTFPKKAFLSLRRMSGYVWKYWVWWTFVLSYCIANFHWLAAYHYEFTSAAGVPELEHCAYEKTNDRALTYTLRAGGPVCSLN